MIGLIKKDILMCKNNYKLIVLMFIFVLGASIVGSMDATFLPVMMSVTSFLSTFSYDEYNKWDAYAVTLPNGRKYVVASKYIATIIISFVTILITILLEIVIGYVTNNVDLEYIFSTMSGCFIAILVIISFMYPFIFKVGIEKGRLILFIGCFGIAGIITLIMKYINLNVSKSFIELLNNYGLIIFFVVSLIILFISYRISRRIYLKKEF